VRAFDFTVDAVKVARQIYRFDPVLRRIVFQLVDAAGSIGANLEEAAAGQSKRDFIAKNCVALKEARESNYWLRVLERSETAISTRLHPLTSDPRGDHENDRGKSSRRPGRTRTAAQARGTAT